MRLRLLFLISLGMLFQGRTIAQQSTVRPYIDGGHIKKKKVLAMLNEVGTPGMSIAIIHHNKVVFAKAYGHKVAGGKRVNKNTVFEAASLSKSFLVFVAQQLVDEGRLKLDTPMYRYLDPGTLLNFDERYKQITPRMILSHSSGLENWRSDNDPSKLEILYDPGTHYIYSGEGYTYLSAVMEMLLEKSYQEYVTERVIKPLGLKQVYLYFDTLKHTPANYAVGHDKYGHMMKKWKNPYPVPAGGVNLTAKEYAKLIIGIFDGKHLSAAREKEIRQPVISMNPNNPAAHFFGEGFEIIYCDKDTLISHGGSNTGFKNLIFYSLVSGDGFVMLTNGDRGKWMAREVAALTTGLDISPVFRDIYYDQYPSNAITLFKYYNEGHQQQMMDSIHAKAARGMLGVNTLNELGEVVMDKDTTMAAQLLLANISYFPDSPRAYYLMGHLKNQQHAYLQALEYFNKAKALHLKDEALESDIAACEAAIAGNIQK